ncbi:DNA mismatch repair protein MutT [Cellulosimicrobium cellulans]|uniref:DNA mismatch repair protein MutT n=1 Tax=Cellulosimicrobium cellulans TaxID=1710 RepID=A0A1Y0HXL0_CELCE|nr:NUDIX domain-containing protein [Cellulosimicrobium cellulans]ARU52881.1 DNA mismatch repair protein MutT [Cellulosimicrobium cellulans]
MTGEAAVGGARASWDDGSASHRFRVVPAAYVLLRRGDQVLLQLRQGTGYRDGFWAAAAAGHVEPGESVVAAAVREAREELGVAIRPAALQPLTVLHRGEPGGPALEQRVDFFFTATEWVGEAALLERDKAADLRWFGLDDLPDPVVPHELHVLRALLAGAAPPIMTFGFDTDT